jgi:hypothetical protein
MNFKIKLIFFSFLSSKNLKESALNNKTKPLTFKF